MAVRGRILGGGLAACIALATPCVVWYEGLVKHTYVDIVGVPTDCYGHTGTDVKPGQKFTTDQCLDILHKDLAREVDDVLDCVHVDLQPWEAAALVSFDHNVGKMALCTSTLAKMANAGAPPEVWCAQMKNWVYGHIAGQAVQLPGLVTRRNTEYQLCMGNPLANTPALPQ